MSYLAAGIGGLGFFAVSVLLLAVWPGLVLERQIRAMSPGHPLPLTAGEQRGRAIYGQDGCAYCHTQQIRYLDRDVRRFGAATLAWETIFDYPQLWGTRRIGPDLSREGAVRSPDWQLSHLYDPRYMVADSVMPPFPWLFDGAPDRPKQEARDLLAYIETLGRNRELAGPEGQAHARAACECSDDERRLAFGAPVLNANPAMTRGQGDYPKLVLSDDRNRGLRLYARNCASCHGAHGEGDGVGAAGLSPHPANFAVHEYTPDRLSFALWNGVAGTAMPAWRDLPVEDLSALAQVVRGFHSPSQEASPSQSVIDSGRQVYADHCAQCHGENGAGDGPAANRFPIAPTNFRMQRASYEVSLRAIHDGVEGTPMAAWTSQLSDAEIDAVTRYVRGFFQP
jgi:cbb3-type cytochrome oxidase cytochrome c subunit